MRRIAIHSVPRSGSTWLGEIFNSNQKTIYKYQPLFSYCFKDRLNLNSSKNEIIKFFEEISKMDDDFLDQVKERKEGVSPVFRKSKVHNTIVYKEVRYHHILENLLKRDEEIIVIGLIRNPFSVINSWLRAPKEFKKENGWNELEEWRFSPKKNLNKPEEFNGFEKWKEVSLLFNALRQKYKNRFFLIQYDELLKDTRQEVKKIFNFCDIDYTKQTEDFIIKSSKTDQSSHTYSVYRNNQVDNKWESQLNPKIIEEIKGDLEGTILKKYI